MTTYRTTETVRATDDIVVEAFVGWCGNPDGTVSLLFRHEAGATEAIMERPVLADVLRTVVTPCAGAAQGEHDFACVICGDTLTLREDAPPDPVSAALRAAASLEDVARNISSAHTFDYPTVMEAIEGAAALARIALGVDDEERPE